MSMKYNVLFLPLAVECALSHTAQHYINPHPYLFRMAPVSFLPRKQKVLSGLQGEKVFPWKQKVTSLRGEESTLLRREGRFCISPWKLLEAPSCLPSTLLTLARAGLTIAHVRRGEYRAVGMLM